jgi:hypothetical protein
MNEQYTSPQPNPELVDMSRGDRLMLDPLQTIYEATEVGLQNETDIYKIGIVAEVTLKGVEERDDDKSFVVIRTDNKFNGMSEVFLAGVTKDESGKRTLITTDKGWVKLESGRATTVGRHGADVDGERLMGGHFGESISRTHLAVELQKDGIVIGDNSSNGTEVIGHRATQSVRSTQVVKSGLIDGVPKSAAEAKAAIAKSDADLLAERNLGINAEIDAIDVQMKDIKEGLSERDALALWKYASGLINKKEAQMRGDGQDSINQEMVAGEGFREMSPKAKGIMHDYHRLMSRKSALLKDSRN